MILLVIQVDFVGFILELLELLLACELTELWMHVSAINTNGPVVVATLGLCDIVAGLSSRFINGAKDIVKRGKGLVKLQIAWNDNDLGLSESLWFVALVCSLRGGR